MRKSMLFLMLMLITIMLCSCTAVNHVRDDETDVVIIQNNLVQPSTTEAYIDVTETDSGFNIDSDLEIKDLIKQYYDYLVDGEYTLASYLTNDNSRLKKEDFISCSENIQAIKSLNCYVMEGMIDGTYIVVAKSGLLTSLGNELINRLEAFYVCTNESGTLYICGGGVSDEVRSYNSIMLSDAKISEFVAVAQQENEQILNTNPEIANLLGVVYDNGLIRFLYERTNTETETTNATVENETTTAEMDSTTAEVDATTVDLDYNNTTGAGE